MNGRHLCSRSGAQGLGLCCNEAMFPIHPPSMCRSGSAIRMDEESRRLVVWCFGRTAGTMKETIDGMAFSYAEGWAEEHMPPLSQSLPRDGSFTDAAVAAFFGGLRRTQHFRLPHGNEHRWGTPSRVRTCAPPRHPVRCGRAWCCRRASTPSRVRARCARGSASGPSKADGRRLGRTSARVDRRAGRSPCGDDV